jgi:hypothetical protein
VHNKSPFTGSTYLDGVKNTLYRLHLGDYGGIGLRIVSFLLGLIGCFVILSGVMIWLTARDKKNIPEQRRRFNEGVVRYYLAICLSMYPVTALSFIGVKAFNLQGIDAIYTFYFVGWLLLTLFFILKRNNNFTNTYCLLLGSILGLLVPVTNGLVSGNWLWVSYSQGYTQILFIDVFWILVALLGFLILYKINKKGKSPVHATLPSTEA